MVYIRGIVIGVILLLIFLFPVFLSPTLAIKYPTLNKAVVQIESQCTGFIAQNKIILTAAHCVLGGDEIRIKFWDQEERTFKVTASSEVIGGAVDWAVLHGDTRDIEPLPTSFEDPSFLDKCYHYRYIGVSQQVAPGLFVIVSDTPDGDEYFIAVNTIPGDSGGPMVCNDVVVGIQVSGFFPIGVELGVSAPLKNLPLEYRTLLDPG